MMRNFRRYFMALFLGSLFPVPVFAQTVTKDMNQSGSTAAVELTGRSGHGGSNVRVEYSGKLGVAHPSKMNPVDLDSESVWLGGGQVCFITEGGFLFGVDGERALDFGQVGVKLGYQSDNEDNSNFTRVELYPYKAHAEGQVGEGVRFRNAAGAKISFVQETADRSPLSFYFDGSVDYLYKVHSDVLLTQYQPPYQTARVQTRTDGVNASLGCGLILGLGRDNMGDRRVALKAGLQYQVAGDKEKTITSGGLGYTRDVLEVNKRSRVMPTVGITINTAAKPKARRSVGGNR